MRAPPACLKITRHLLLYVIQFFLQLNSCGDLESIVHIQLVSVFHFLCKAKELQVSWRDPKRTQVAAVTTKGAPAQESCTGTRLVSPATGCKKNKRHLGAGPQNTKLSTIEIILASTDAMETGTATGKPLKPESMWKKRKEKKNIPWRSEHIWTFFFPLHHHSMPV